MRPGSLTGVRPGPQSGAERSSFRATDGAKLTRCRAPASRRHSHPWSQERCKIRKFRLIRLEHDGKYAGFCSVGGGRARLYRNLS